MLLATSPLLLILNASVLWGIVSGLLTWALRFKTLVLVILISPLILTAPFSNIAGMPELVAFYGQSLIYGAPGILVGMIYANYHRIKRQIANMSKASMLARLGIGLSSIYLLGFFGQKIIFENPMVELALGFIKGGDQAKEVAQMIDYDGAIKAGGVIIACVLVLLVNTYRDRKTNKTQVVFTTNRTDTGPT